jgi:AraC family transcriptional regulator
MAADKIYIKNMVCNRCIRAVDSILNGQLIPHENVQLGEVTLLAPLKAETKNALNAALKEEGFELIDDRRSRLIEKIKKLILKRINTGLDESTDNLSDYLAGEMHLDYSYLSNLFSSVEGMTIEKYFIAQKIEKVKELLVYNELSLSEIAFRLGYSSVQYLSNQFRKTTGLTPSHFRKVGADKRKPLDQVP